MADLEIPFSDEMAIAAIDGYKVATTRSEKKGEIGDTFWFEDPRREGEERMTKYGTRCRLLEIMNVDLETVKNLYFRLEGFESPDAFETTWRALHRGHFTVLNPDKTTRTYFIHFFGRVA